MAKQKRLLLIAPRYFPEKGGIETVIFNLNKHFLEINNNLRIFVIISAKIFKIDIINQITIIRAPALIFNESFNYIPRLRKIVNRINPDVIHIHGAHSLSSIIGIHKTAKVQIFSPHYHGKSENLFRNVLLHVWRIFVLDKIFNNSKIVISNSKIERKVIMRDFNNIGDKLVNMNYGISFGDGEYNIGRRKGKLKILSVSRLIPHKGIMIFLERIIDKINSDYELVIVGKGVERDKILKFIAENNLENKIFIKENLSPVELLDEYKSSSHFVSMSFSESYGLAVADAILMGMSTLILDSHPMNYQLGKLGNIFSLKANYWDETINKWIKYKSNKSNSITSNTWLNEAKKIMSYYFPINKDFVPTKE